MEHCHRHDVPKVLAGILHVLNACGFAQVRVPDLGKLISRVAQIGMDLDQVLEGVAHGAFHPARCDLSHGSQIASSDMDFYAHKCGFTAKLLTRVVEAAGFGPNFAKVGDLEINIIFFKGQKNPEDMNLFSIQIGAG